MTDILDQIDSTLAEVSSCACGCGKSISEKGPSGDFSNEFCQARWMARRVGTRPELVAPPHANAAVTEDLGTVSPPVDAALEHQLTGDEIADFAEATLGVEVEPWQRQMLHQLAEAPRLDVRPWWRRMFGDQR